MVQDRMTAQAYREWMERQMASRPDNGKRSSRGRGRYAGFVLPVPSLATGTERMPSRESELMSDAQRRLGDALCAEVTIPEGPKAPLKRRAQPEFDLHVACVEWANTQADEVPVLHFLHHSPNGGIRPRGEAGKLKVQGAKAGFPDLILPARSHRYNGLAIELKSPAGRLSTDQRRWLLHFYDEGYLVGVCRTLETFQDLIRQYLLGGEIDPEYQREIHGNKAHRTHSGHDVRQSPG